MPDIGIQSWVDDDLAAAPNLTGVNLYGTQGGSSVRVPSGLLATSAQGALANTAVPPGDLATVATSGVYNDLSGRPSLGTAAAANTTAFATAAQGALADTAVQPGDPGPRVTGGDTAPTPPAGGDRWIDTNP